MKKYCYATAITKENYILGLKALAICLQKVGTVYPLVVFIPEDSYTRIMKAIIECDFLVRESNVAFHIVFRSLPRLDVKQYGIDNQTFSNWNDSFFKLQAFLLEEYEKVMLIDSDMLVIRNLDHLFEKPIYSAANSGNAKWNGFNSLNSGLMLIKPSSKVHSELIKLIPAAKKKREDAGFNVGDQDVIREYLSTWPEDDELHLDEGYNLYIHHAKYYLKNNDKKNIYILHFVGPTKPFHYSGFTVIKYFLKSNCFFSLGMKYLYFLRFRDKKTKVRYV